jgi:hypothetical protein
MVGLAPSRLCVGTDQGRGAQTTRGDKGTGIDNLAPVLEAVASEHFYNVSKLDLPNRSRPW